MILEDREDRWVAALCHASVVIFMMGAIVPLVVWVTQKDRSKTLRFQALQGLVYQLVGTLSYFLIMMFMFLLGIGLIVFALLVGAMFPEGSGGSQDIGGVAAMVIGILFVLIMLVQFGSILIGPLYILLGLWGGLRTLRGVNFHYPFLGKFIERRLEVIPDNAGEG
jgi:uncharacterized Tic20 family protein